MGFLDDLLKDVEKGVDRLQKGADKLITETNLRSEIEKLKRQQRDLLAEIGEEAVALYVAGEIALPGLSMQIAQLQELREQIEAKQEQLEALPPQSASEKAGGAQPVSAAADAPAPSASGFCEQCGAPLPAGAAFCGQCGHKVT